MFFYTTTTTNNNYQPTTDICETETLLVEISSRVQILESGDLLISNVRETDAGLYSCVRSNEAGTVQGEAHLGVLGKWNVVVNLSVVIDVC